MHQLAPEYQTGEYSFKEDVFGLGVIAYELFTRKSMFSKKDGVHFQIPIDREFSFDFIRFIHDTVRDDP